MVVSGGKKYIKNEYLEEVSDDPREPDAVKRLKEDSTPESGTVIVWEALRACHMHQVRVLGRGDTWASHDNVRRCEQEWEERQMGARSHSGVSASKEGRMEHSTRSEGIVPSDDLQPRRHVRTQSHAQDKISVILPDAKKLLVVCQKPVLLNKLQEAVCTQACISGSVSLFLRKEGGTVELSNQDQLDWYLALQDRPHICANKDSLLWIGDNL